MLDIDEVVFHRAYDRVANSLLWFVAHLLCSPATTPDVRRGQPAGVGAATRRTARAFADALAGGGRRRARRCWCRTTTCRSSRRCCGARGPTCGSATSATRRGRRRSTSGCCPTTSPGRCSRGCSAPTRVGFLSPRWADAFGRCCADVLGAVLGRHARSGHAGRATAVAVHAARGRPGRAAGPGRRSRRPSAGSTTVRETVGDRRLLLRIDRTELSKNIVRGLQAYGELLRTRPEWRERVVHLAFAYPSRHDLPEYREYTAAVQRTAREVNEEFATPGWLPVRAAGARRLRALAGGVPARRRAGRQPGARRHEPGGQGGPGAVAGPASRWCCPARRAPPTSSAPTRCWSTRTTSRRPPRRCTGRCSCRPTSAAARCERLADGGDRAAAVALARGQLAALDAPALRSLAELS